MTTPQATNFSFCSDDLPARDRLAIWREVYARTILKVDVEQIGDDPFRCDAKVTTLPGLGVASIAMPRTRIRRTRAMIADGTGAGMILVNIPLEGRAVVSQIGREALVDAGEGVAVATSELLSCDFRRTRGV